LSLELSDSPPPVVVTASLPPVSVQPLGGSLPPISRAGGAATGSLPPVSRAGAGPLQGSLPPVNVAASLPPMGRPASPQPPAPFNSLPAPRHTFQATLAPAQGATLLERLLPGGIVLGLALLLAVLDQAYSAAAGEIFSLGPLRTSVVSGLLMVLGIGLCVFRMIKRS
jgi:hypothetical protein